MSKGLLFIFILLFQSSIHAQGNFIEEADDLYYLVILPVPGWTDMPDMVGGLAKYNVKNYKEEQYLIKMLKMKVSDKLPFVLMSEFENESEAIIYYQRMKSKLPNFLHMGLSRDFFIISRENYNESILLRSFEEYQDYFKTKYHK